MPNQSTTVLERPRILHLSADFPDPLNAAKTPVIERLIDLVSDQYRHHVISLNRRQPTFGQFVSLALGAINPAIDHSLQPFRYGKGLAYLAPAKGILHATMLERLADWICEHVALTEALPDLVMGHKLTIEGILARKVARRLGVPFAITIQGNTDLKIIDARRDLRSRFASIYHEAACVFSFAPWAHRAVSQRLGRPQTQPIDLPCPTVLDQIRAPFPGGKRLISVFHLRNHRIKNVAGMANAMRIAQSRGCKAELEIIGGGTQAEMAACEAAIAKASNITLAGPREHGELGATMNSAIALVMPSLRESFGLVFVEALFAGLPIIYPRGAGIDGYFDDLPFAIAVNAKKADEIAEAIRYAVAHEEELKQALAQWQASGGLARFSSNAIRSTFDSGLTTALAQRKLA